MNAKNRTPSLAAGALLLAVACQPAAIAPASAPLPPTAPAASTSEVEPSYETVPVDQREPPPPASPTPAWSFPPIVDGALSNGLRTKFVARRTLPLVSLRLIVYSGQATDGDKPGLANLAGEMLKVGGTGAWTSRDLLERVESLGGSLNVTTARDSTTIDLAVTAEQFEAALSLIAAVAQKPQFNREEFAKLKQREIDRVDSLARSSGSWVASRVLYEKLFAAKQGRHPYATFDNTATEFAKRTLAECQTWHKQHFTPKNSTLLVTGDVDVERLKRATEQEFGAWRGGSAPVAKFPELKPHTGLELYLVDRPASPQAEVVLGLFGPERKSSDFVPMTVANQILGGGVAGRLFGDVREKRSLAYSTFSTYDRVARGPAPLLLKAGTQTAKAGLTLQALLEHAELLGASPPSDAELQLATRFLTDVFLLRVETVSAIAAMTTELAVFGLPNDYYDRYRESVGTTMAPQILDVGGRFYAPNAGGIAVIAGDAERLSTPLSHFADVVVIDPEAGFRVKRTVPKNPAAPVELPRVEGT